MGETIGLPHWTLADALPTTGDKKLDTATRQRWQATQENFESLVTQTAKQLAAAFQQRLPPGIIQAYAMGTSPPTGYLACDGGAVSRGTYADLFDVLGVAWGAGDGVTTFNVPNYNQDRFPRGHYPPGAIGGGGVTTSPAPAGGVNTPFLVAPGAPFDNATVGLNHTHEFTPPYQDMYFIVKT